MGMTVIGGVGLVFQGIVWIIFAAINKQIDNYLSLSILLVVEIIPTFLLLSMLKEHKMGEAAPTQSSRTKTNSAKKSKTPSGQAVSKTTSKTNSKTTTSARSKGSSVS